MNPESNSVAVDDLPIDMKRMLRIQFKEFIYLLEDGEVLYKPGTFTSTLSNTTVIKHICYGHKRVA